MTDARRIFEALGGKGWNGTSANCHCPAHNDKNASLTVSVGRNGQPLVHCHAGCSQEAVIDRLKAMGLWPKAEERTDRPPGIQSIWKKNKDGEPHHYVQHWSYENETGEIIGYEVRYESENGVKVPIPYFNKTDGKWRTGYPKDKGYVRPLYNLPAVKEADEVWVVEGPKCAAFAWQEFGLTATTSPNGGGAASKADWSPLSDKRVVIWPDNDDPGRKYAMDVLTILKGLEKPPQSIRMVEVEKLGLAEKDDIVDWAKAADMPMPIADLPLKEVEDTTDLGVIHLEGGELLSIVEKCEKMLLKRFPNEVFQRGEWLVRVVSLEAGSNENGIDRKPGALQIVAMEDKFLTQLFMRSASFFKYDKVIKDFKPVDLPDKYAKHYLARFGEWEVPVLNGIIEAPTLRRDGTLLHRRGYDKETGLYVDTHGPTLDVKPMPGDPEDLLSKAKGHLRTLRALLSEFPFVSGEDESVALAAILTPLVRKSIDTAPLFAFTAPAPGTGKSMLADVVSMIATGRRATVMSQATDPIEEKKRLLALLMSGDPLLVIDNVEQPIKGDTLAAVLTTTSYQDRVLQASKHATVSTAVTFLATGNNLVFKGDMTRRALLCTMDAKMERPDEREFKRNLYDYVRRARNRLIGSALYLLRAYHHAGKPDMGLTPYAGFKEWSDWVRSSLVWAGMVDPYETRKKIEAEDPEKNLHERFLNAWFGAFGDRSLRLQDAIADCKESAELKHKNLLEVLREIAPEGRDDVNPVKLARGFFPKIKEVLRNELKLEKDPSSPKNVARWRVIATTTRQQLKIVR